MSDAAPDWYNALPDANSATAASPPAANDTGNAPAWYNALPDAALPTTPSPHSTVQTPNAFDTATEKMANMATFGMGAPIDAVAKMAADKVRNLVGVNTPEVGYDEALQQAQQRQEQESDQHPIASALGSTAGFLGGMGNAPQNIANAAKAVPSMFDLAMQGAKMGVPMGAVSTATNTPGDWETKAEAGGVGGVIGGVLGAAAPPIVAGAGKILSPLVGLAKPFFKSGQEQLAGKILNEATEGRPIIPESAPTPGVSLTTGQATNDPGLLWMEKSLQQKNPSAAVQADTANNQAMIQAAGVIGNPKLAADSPDTIQTGIEAARDANQKIVRDTWQQAGVNDATPLSTQPLKDDMAAHIASLPKADQAHVPQSSMTTLSSFDENEPLGEVQALRSDLQSQATAASRAGDYNKARILGGLTDVVGKHTDDPSIAAAATSGQLEDMFSTASGSVQDAQKEVANLNNKMTQLQAQKQTNPSVYGPNANDEKALQQQITDAQTRLQQAQDAKAATLDRMNAVQQASSGDNIPAYQQARAETANFKQNFQQPAPVRNVLGVDKFGADKVPLSSVPDQFIRSGKGAPEAFQAFMNATRQADPATQQATFDAARNTFAQKFFDNVTSGATDQQGTNKIVGSKVDDFLNDYKHVVNSSLFTDAQRQTMQDIATSARMAARTAKFSPPGGGSPTYGYLEQGRFIDSLLTGWQKPVVKAAGAGLGAMAGSHLGPLGTLAGAVEGNKLGAMLSKIPQEKTMAILQRAMLDPQLAQTLQMKANAFSQKAMNPAVYQYLSSMAIKSGIGATQAISGPNSNAAE